MFVEARLACSALCLCLLALVPEGSTLAQEYSLPLGKDAPLTSTFGEYRTRHFHGGLDLSTGGETGLEVYAASSGRVWRLRVSGSGYGKAIYLKLDDGRIAVYAHLEDFAPAIRERAEAIQRSRGTYRIDHIFEEGGPRVGAGELIAYSGESGAGPAHLHFELRDGDTQLNPLTCGVMAHDTLPPTIRSIMLIPLGPGSTVDGSEEPIEIGLRWDGSTSAYTTGRVPVIEGDVGIACRTYDLANGKPNRLAPYHVELRVDGEVAYDLRFDKIPLLSSHHVELVYNYRYAMRGSRNVLNLFCVPGARAGVTREPSPWRGALSVAGSGKLGGLSLSVGRHDIEVRARDVSGNCRRAVMCVAADNRPVISHARFDSCAGTVSVEALDPDGEEPALLLETSSDGGRTWSGAAGTEAGSLHSGQVRVPVLGATDIVRVTARDKAGLSSRSVFLGPGLRERHERPPETAIALLGDYAEVVCDLPAPSAAVPTLLLVDADAAEPIKSLRTHRRTTDSFRAVIPLREIQGCGASVLVSVPGPNGPRAAIRNLGLTGFGNGEACEVELPFGALMAVPEGAFLRDTVLRTVVRDSAEFNWNGELRPLSDVYELTPADQFLDKPVSLFLPLEGTPRLFERVGLYRSAGPGEWRWVGGATRGRGRLIGGTISHLSAFILMEDTAPPRVVSISPGAGRRVKGPRPTLEARVKDEGSGLDWDKAYFRIDGERLITAWESERNHAWVRVPHDLPAGPHEVEFFAEDRAGNEIVRTVSIVVTR